MRAHHTLLPLHYPLATARGHNILDDWLALMGLLASLLLPHVFSLLVATDVITNTVEPKSMNTTLLPVNLGWNLRNFLVKVIQIIRL